IVPLLSESGYVSADEMTGNLLLIDTVQNLLRIETIIAQFDVPEAEGTVTEILEVLHSDPSEIVQLLRMLLSEGNSRSTSAYGSAGRYSTSSRRPYSGSSLYRSGSGSSGSNSMLVGPSQMPVVLIPESKRKWIIARASAQDMKSIREWVAKLDREEPLEREYETIPITYADPREVATQLNQALQQMPGTELEASVLVQPLDQAKQIVVFGRRDLREMVKKLIEEIDVPPGQFLTEHFKLKYADPDVIERNVNDLYGESRLVSSRRAPGQTGTSVSPDTVKVISHLALKEVTVVASPGNMDKIKEQIGQWDVPIDVNQVKPRIIELRNSDTVQMRDLLTTLFSREAAGNRFSVYDYLFGFGHQDKEKIIGPLYGQLTFEDVPGTKKIIVISNIPGAYDVVEDLVRALDQQEMAEVPKVIKLRYRNPETLAESLNAMFNETGTSASIRLSERGLSDYSMDDSQGTTTNNNSRNTANASSAGRGAGPVAEYRPWWTTGRTSIGEMPISNVIGRARFIPDRYSSSILALAPPEFMQNIEEMIRELDMPGKQVMIKAIIVQIDHTNMTSLGVQLSSDQARWATLDNENAITARNILSLLGKHGALVFGAGGDAGNRSEVSVSADVSVLIDFLVKELNAKILNQQTLWTKDNEEAEFFKGQRVGFQTRVSISDTGGRATSDYEYEKVGMTLRTRPSITPEKNVDMIINVVLSQLTPEEINNQRVRTEMDTTTNMIVQDGQTLMLGGMLFQEDSNVQRKLPLLGDLPLIGGLFRHNEGVMANSELLIFVTPYVVDGLEETLPETLKEIEQPKSRLRDVQQQLRRTGTESAPSTSEATGEENPQ
ncbi:MAG TPA: secretin N-terminal domain-containing protein, partial [Sedimentisphaerales bacterium]|nr:secretin N-terminal domain-containing protein [Sedimentisphaerales bacterium]